MLDRPVSSPVAYAGDQPALRQRNLATLLELLRRHGLLTRTELAQITGLFQWRIRRHFRPAIYRRLSTSILARYADAFGLPVEQLIGYQKAPA